MFTPYWYFSKAFREHNVSKNLLTGNFGYTSWLQEWQKNNFVESCDTTWAVAIMIFIYDGSVIWMCVFTTKNIMFIIQFKPFVANASILYLLKTPENKRFFVIFRGWKMGILPKHELRQQISRLAFLRYEY